MPKSFLKPLLALSLCLLISPLTALASQLFPQPASLTPAVDFWTKVYTQVTDSEGYIHDDRRLNIIYQSLQLTGKPGKGQRRQMRAAIANWREALLSLAKGKRSSLNQYQRKALAIWGKDASAKTLKAAAKRLRFQRGQSNKFRAGLIRSGAYKPAILKILKGMSMPLDLAALPHVESSFNPLAHSHAGAAGMWQFTRSTGRRFMRIDSVVDERMHPFKASKAAARLLQHNYSVLQSWPLALTAYNHGLSGMRRAVKKMGTSNIGAIVKGYKGRLFGFASRNFYAAFLAARAVSSKPKHYFGSLNTHQPKAIPTIKIEAFLPAERVAQTLNIKLTTLRKANPVLRSAVWQGLKHIPRGYAVQLPYGTSASSKLKQRLQRLAQREGDLRQRPDRYHVVRRGDSLSRIATRYHTSVRSLMAMNQLRSRHRIRIGQRLKLPGAFRKPTTPRRTVLAQARHNSGQQSTAASYRVRKGDTLSTIAQRTGMNQSTLQRLNGIRNPKRIYPGQKLILAEAAKATISPITSPKTRNVIKPTSNTPKPAAKLEPIPKPITVASLNTTNAPNIKVTPVTTPENAAAIDEPETTTEEEEHASPITEQPELSADPADYEVDSKGNIEVQSVETLGHYADWLGIATQSLRRLNRLSRHQRVYIGQRLKLNFSKINRQEFVKRRVAYQERLQSDYFERHRIQGSKIHTLRRGESLWALAVGRYNIPLWLLRQYNPDISLKAVLPPGSALQIPLVEKL